MAYLVGRQAHPGIELSFEAFAGRTGDAPRASADYYLARACEAGAPGAWERLQARYTRPLRAFLRKRGASGGEAERVLEDAWGALATPPARGGAQTRIGTYDGRGTLHAWLATVAWRRLADHWRAGAALPPSEPAELHAGGRHRDPADHASAEETARLLGQALEDAWSRLTERELQVLVLKYCHGLQQTAIAQALRIGPPRVTRLLKSAMTRLRTAIEARFRVRPDWGASGGGWASLFEAVEHMLARTAASIEVPLPGRDHDA